MSETETKFQIEIDDETTLSRDSMVAHAKHGAMRVDQVTVSAHGKRARLTAMDHPERMSLELTADELRTQWGESIGADPFEISTGEATFTNEFESDELGVTVSLEVSGPENESEVVMCHLHDQTVRVMQSLETGLFPADCDGVFNIDWEEILADRGGED